jgi:hypothetical protein
LKYLYFSHEFSALRASAVNQELQVGPRKRNPGGPRTTNTHRGTAGSLLFPKMPLMAFISSIISRRAIKENVMHWTGLIVATAIFAIVASFAATSTASQSLLIG